MSARKTPSKSAYTPEKPSNSATYILGAIAVVIAAIAVVGMVLWQQRTSEPVDEGYGTVREAPVAIADDGVIVLGFPDAPRSIAIFEDHMCEGCQSFERLFGQHIARVIDEGEISVEYNTMNFLDPASGSGTYSTRAAAAAECVAETGNGAAFSGFHAALYEAKPRSGEDRTNEELADVAREAGADDAAVDCIATGAREDAAREHADLARAAMEAAGGQGTPTVVADGEIVDWNNRHWLNNLIGE
ncbi:DsbA family protein [Hoyosella altamirensis]|uniref:Protein-disulfide isomerase n=1 Tax=Hoyosella altamirensis TaxID=616997 RepID=A0A839RI23_9ACTN|nr:thioredoxin domain-containing protein [Hoyosella altamirensis]MBB3035711.1 protein-disulfide isomerase [Hoyosella altamirensis]